MVILQLPPLNINAIVLQLLCTTLNTIYDFKNLLNNENVNLGFPHEYQ